MQPDLPATEPDNRSSPGRSASTQMRQPASGDEDAGCWLSDAAGEAVGRRLRSRQPGGDLGDEDAVGVVASYPDCSTRTTRRVSLSCPGPRVDRLRDGGAAPWRRAGGRG